MKNINTHTVSGFIGREMTVTETSSMRVIRFTLRHPMGKDRDPLYIDLTLFQGEKDQRVPEELLQEQASVVVTYRMAPNNWEKDGKRYYRTQNIVTSMAENPVDAGVNQPE